MSAKQSALWAPAPSTSRGQATKLDGRGDKIVYTSGRGVFIRDLRNPAACIAYLEHVKDATVARLSPSGAYCASADVTGAVRVWDVLGTDQILKSETKVIAGRITDLAWGESTRIIAVGDGKQSFGHAFSTSSFQSPSHARSDGHVVELRQHRGPQQGRQRRRDPPAAAVPSGDGRRRRHDRLLHRRTVQILQGHQDALVVRPGALAGFQDSCHASPRERSFVLHDDDAELTQSLSWTPSGAHFASAGADRKVFVHDGQSGDLVHELVDGSTAHTGGVFACSFSSDSRSLATSSADQTVKLWDVECVCALAALLIVQDEQGRPVGRQAREGADRVGRGASRRRRRRCSTSRSATPLRASRSSACLRPATSMSSTRAAAASRPRSSTCLSKRAARLIAYRGTSAA